MASKEEELGFLTGEDARLLMAEAIPYSFEAGDVIVEAGSRPHALFFLRRGAVREGNTQLEAPALLGEAAFVDGGVTVHRVVAEKPCDVHVIDGVCVNELVEWAPDFGARLYRSLAALLAHRLREMNGLSRPAPF